MDPRVVQPLLNILLVEDDEVDVMTVQRALAQADVKHQLTVDRDPTRALARLERSAQGDGDPLPSVMIFDLDLPLLTGLELLDAVKRNDRLARIPTVILTTSEREPDVARAFELGAAGYFVKPVDFDRFVDVMQTLCRYWSVSAAAVPAEAEFRSA